jgi:acyl-CoA thioester hydrolase
MKFTYCCDVRFNDVDVMGHVNNAVYLSYFEMARMNFFNQLIGDKWDWHDSGILLVRNEIDYLKPIFLNDKVEIETFCLKIGIKSFVLSYELYRTNDDMRELCTKGESVQVCYDYSKQTTIEVPEAWKTALIPTK